MGKGGVSFAKGTLPKPNNVLTPHQELERMMAGNFVNTDILASLEYAVAVLNTQPIMVLGHTSCGAIDAAVKAYTKNASYPVHIQVLTTALAPAVRKASKKSECCNFSQCHH